MSETIPLVALESWYKNNDDFLAAALYWLRLKLEFLGEQAHAPAIVTAPPARRRGRLFPRPPRAEQPALPAKTTSQLKEAVDAAHQAMRAAEAVDPPPALRILGYRFSLSAFERDILLLCAGMELDTNLPSLCAYAQDNANRPYPTFALALNLFDEPSWDALSASRPLRYWRLIEINQPGATPLTISALRADERVVNYLKGINQMDDLFSPLLLPFDAAVDVDVPPSLNAQREGIQAALARWTPAEPAPLFQLIGRDHLAKQQLVRQALSRLGWQAYRMSAAQLPASPGELETFTRLWQRESLLLPLALYLDLPDEGESHPGESQATLSHFLSRSGTVTFLDTRESQPQLAGRTETLEVGSPTPTEQQSAWSNLLGLSAGHAPAQLAAQFNLNLQVIRGIARRVIEESKASEENSLPPGASEQIRERVWQECLSRTRPRLDRLAQRIEPKATWKQLVMPAEQLGLLHEIAGQVRARSKVYEEWGFRQMMNRGFGISALFTGESGTGKTMAAEVIANELHLYLYRIDLSAVVSKYIGETEKNLRRVFDAAEDGGVILFFDEADALFGKRSEVKDSHDRYANIEINYLLQRMEAFHGLAILATNMKSALDQAFWRRLRFIVNFPFPGLPERRSIWERVIPPELPRESLDFDHLARLNLTGGSIHNIIMNAAFRAAQADTPLNMTLLMESARNELRKLDRPVNETDLRLPKPVEVHR